jgi:hypothetical protein
MGARLELAIDCNRLLWDIRDVLKQLVAIQIGHFEIGQPLKEISGENFYLTEI